MYQRPEQPETEHGWDEHTVQPLDPEKEDIAHLHLVFAGNHVVLLEPEFVFFVKGNFYGRDRHGSPLGRPDGYTADFERKVDGDRVFEIGSNLVLLAGHGRHPGRTGGERDGIRGLVPGKHVGDSLYLAAGVGMDHVCGDLEVAALELTGDPVVSIPGGIMAGYVDHISFRAKSSYLGDFGDVVETTGL